MQMTDSQRIPATRDRVWAALNDPEILKACIPGCDSLEMTSPTAMTAKVTLKIGPVKATFAGKVTLSDLDPPNGYRITGEGSGGVAGFAKGGAEVTLEEDGPDATVLNYSVDAQIGGKLAQLGARLIDSTSKRLAGEFFTKFAAVVAPPPPDAVADDAGGEVGGDGADGGAVAEGEAGATEPEAKKGWIKGLFSKPGAVAPVIALAAFAALAAHACCLGGSHAAIAMPMTPSICGSGPAA